MDHAIYSNLVGVKFRPGSVRAAVENFQPYFPVTLRREPNNKYDSNAVAVCANFPIFQVDDRTTADVEEMIGYLERSVAKQLAPVMDGGMVFDAHLHSRTGDAAAPWLIEIYAR